MAHADNQVKIADGRITLYQRDDVKDGQWQCRMSVKGHKGYLVRRSFDALKNTDVSFYTMRDCVLRPALFLSPWSPWRTIALTTQQMKMIRKLGCCVKDASIALSYFEEAQKISYDFNANFKRITGDDTHFQKGLDFINLNEMVKFDIAKLKEPTRKIIESAKY